MKIKFNPFNPIVFYTLQTCLILVILLNCVVAASFYVKMKEGWKDKAFKECLADIENKIECKR